MNSGELANRIIGAAPGATSGAAGLLRGLFGGTTEQACAFAAAHWGLIHVTGAARTTDVRAVQAELLRLLSSR